MAGNLLTGTINWNNYQPVVPNSPSPQAFNINSVKDVPTLNTALKSGQINSQQWMTRFKQIQPQQPKIQTGVLPNLNPFNSQSVVNQQDITPIKNNLVAGYQKAMSQAKYLAGPPSTPQQRAALLNNQKVLQAQANPQFNTSNPSGAKGLQRVSNDVVSAFQHINPFSGVHDANKLISQAQQNYGLTPNFVKTLHNANTSITNKSLANGTAQAVTVLPNKESNVTNRTQVNTIPQKGAPKGYLNNTGGTPSSVLVHEGLHQVWAANPQAHQAFAQAYNQAASQDKGLQGYLNAVLNVNGKAQLTDFNKMPPALQDEVHSATATYYLNQQKITSNNPLNKYYSQYLNLAQGYDNQDNTKIDNKKAAPPVIEPNNAYTTYQKATQGLKSGENSVHGISQAQAMAVQGASATQIRAFLQKDAQALGKQTSQGVNTALTLAGFSAPGEGILAKTVGSKLGDVVNAARAGDEGVNTLINTQRVAQATKQATLADKLGTPAVKDASTTQIPVTEAKPPTQIPVTGTSTQVAGKVTTNPPANYVTASNKLSDQYEKDLAKIQSVPHPVTQQVLQTQLDRKYQGLQANLDDKFGQTKVSFTGKPTTLSEATTAARLPRSALDTQTTPFNPTRIPVTDANAKSVPTTTSMPKMAETVSTKPTTQATAITGNKVAGSALNAESRAIQKGLVADLGEKSTYSGGSYKQEADKAASLVNEKPEEAMQIAMGQKAGDNVIHEVAVRRAVENKALQNGDVGTLTRLASSPQHTATSEAAQRLGTEGFSADRNSPVQAIREISNARAVSLAKKGQSADKVVASTAKEIEQATRPGMKVSRQDWGQFIESLRC